MTKTDTEESSESFDQLLILKPLTRLAKTQPAVPPEL